MRRVCGALAAAMLQLVGSANSDIAAARKAQKTCPLATMPVALAAGASEFEWAAAEELALWAGRVGGRAAPLEVVDAAAVGAKPHFAVGFGAALAAGVSAAQLSPDKLGNEGFMASSVHAPGVVVLSGAPNATRGALYAGYHYLWLLGVRFLAENATIVPSCPVTGLPMVNETNWRPAFEYRAVNSWAALADPLQAQRLHLNDGAHLVSASDSVGARQPAPVPALPAAITSPYANGYFVHSIYTLLQAPPINGGPRQGPGPPTALFNSHREWFWPRDAGPAVGGQVCWSNASLVAQLILATKGVLRGQPDARIMSISQNDNLEQCKSPEELAVIAEEQSPAGPLLRAINAIAEAIAEEFPLVAIDTLAYTYNAPAPLLTKVRPNVIVRLCVGDASAPVDFLRPFASEANRPFRAQLQDWREKANATRLFVWNYVCDFGNYIQTFPNYENLGQDLQFLAEHTAVTGVFEESCGTGWWQHNPWGFEPTGPGPGTDMDELKSYVMASMLWDPTQDPDALLSEFVVGYYSEAAAPHVLQFLQSMAETAANATALNTPSTNRPQDWRANGPAFLTFGSLLRANAALSAGIAATPVNSLYRARLRKASMALLLPSLFRWDELRAFASSHSVAWPPGLPQAKEDALRYFGAIYNESGTAGLVNVNFSPCGVASWATDCVFECSLAWLRECVLATTPSGCPITGHPSGLH